MNLIDIIALAKQGYKPSDIKELIALGETESKEEPAPTENPAEEAPHDDVQNEPVKQEEQPEPDYKKLYEESQAALKIAQHANINKEVPAADSPEKVLTRFFE